MKRMALYIGLTFFLILLGFSMQEKPAQAQQKAETGKGNLSQQKQEYQEKMDEIMSEFQQKLTELKGKAAQAEGDLKVKMDKAIHEIQEKMDDLQKKLETMKPAIGKKLGRAESKNRRSRG